MKGCFKMERTEKKVCSICYRVYTGYGNNAQPVNNGYCCDDCNSKYVIPMRIDRFYKGLDMREVIV